MSEALFGLINGWAADYGIFFSPAACLPRCVEAAEQGMFFPVRAIYQREEVGCKFSAVVISYNKFPTVCAETAAKVGIL